MFRKPGKRQTAETPALDKLTKSPRDSHDNTFVNLLEQNQESSSEDYIKKLKLRSSKDQEIEVGFVEAKGKVHF